MLTALFVLFVSGHIIVNNRGFPDLYYLKGDNMLLWQGISKLFYLSCRGGYV